MKIALKGWGVAGQARFRAIETMPHIKCAGIISRRQEFATLDWNQALQDPAIQAIAISTENMDHAKSVREALAAGKHVLCDYPVALSFEEAKELFLLAKHEKRVLHVEHIALLTAAHRELKEKIQKMPALKTGSYVFQGAWNQKLADTRHTGPSYLIPLSRLLQLAEFFGSFKIELKKHHVDAENFCLELDLHFSGGAVLHFTEKRQAAWRRKRSLEFQCGQTRIKWNPVLKKENLFAQDLELFYQRLYKDHPCYYEEKYMLEILRQLSNLFKKNHIE